MSSAEPIWQLLVAEPASLTCEQCFAVIEYFFETLGNDHDALFPIVEAYLERCPDCVIKQHLIRYRMLADEGRTEDDREPVG
jgi:hypothetical protein